VTIENRFSFIIRAMNMNSQQSSSEKVLRFRKSEIKVHWAIAVPFIICYVTALILVIFYNPQPDRPYRAIFSWIHRISGVSFIALPLLVMFKSRKDMKLYIYNIKQAWDLGIGDLKWFFLKGLSIVNKKVKLPEQGKFIVTGILIWITNALMFWFIHFGMAIISTPLIIGHIFMATINPDTRAALSGMISGMVDRSYVKHHHGNWYKEQFEDDVTPDAEDGPSHSIEDAEAAIGGQKEVHR
jgi:cytochrome b subunit of formate dehydrogenase